MGLRLIFGWDRPDDIVSVVWASVVVLVSRPALPGLDLGLESQVLVLEKRY